MTLHNYRSPALADRIAALLATNLQGEVDRHLSFRFERVEPRLQPDDGSADSRDSGNA